MRPPARPRVPPKPAARVTKSAMPAAPAKAPARTARQKPAKPAPRKAAAPKATRSEVIPRPRDQRTGRPTVSTAMTRRLAERRAMRRHRLWRVVLAWTAGLVATGALVWAAFFSTLLALDPHRVAITGQGTTIDVAQVREHVDAEAGVPLPRLDTVGLRERLLELNGVKDVRISRGWPDGLRVALVSREPVAAVPHGGRVTLVDAEGVRVGTARSAPRGLPVVEVGLGEKDAPALQAALHVLAALPPELSARDTHVSADTRDDVRTTLRSGRVVRWGSDARMPYKVAVVRSLQKAAKSAEVFDVSSPDLPVTR